MADSSTVVCTHCGVANELPPEAYRYGSFRCHACGQVNPVPEPPEAEASGPVHEEPVQTEASFTTSKYNTPEAMRRAEIEATSPGCLVAALLVLLLALLVWL